VETYGREAPVITAALGDNCLAIHHFGSTAVPGLAAKPKVDILAVVASFARLNVVGLEALGFENRGELIPTGRYFSKQSPAVHLHLFEEGNPAVWRNLAFRDRLRSHEGDRRAYESLKRRLAAEHTDGMEYCRAKGGFIEAAIGRSGHCRRFDCGPASPPGSNGLK